MMRSVVPTVLREANVNMNDLSNFLQETRESDFLFGTDVHNYLEELYGKASEVHVLSAGLPATVEQQTTVLNWFSGQGDIAKEKFKPYMMFGDST